MSDHQDRYIPAETNGGWPVAGGVVGLAVVCIVVVAMIYKKTYKHPTDVSWKAGAVEATHAPAPAAATHK